MLRINEIHTPLGAGGEEIKTAAARQIGVPLKDITHFEIVRESVDSRQKNSIRMIYSVNVELDGDEESVAARFPQNKVSLCERYTPC